MFVVIVFLHIQAALGLNIKYKEVSALTGEGVEDVSYSLSLVNERCSVGRNFTYHIRISFIYQWSGVILILVIYDCTHTLTGIIVF